MFFGIEKLANLHVERSDPVGIALVNAFGKFDKFGNVATARDRVNADRRGGGAQLGPSTAGGGDWQKRGIEDGCEAHGELL
jgi:hypothetical protein